MGKNHYKNSIYKMFYNQYKKHPESLALIEENADGSRLKLTYGQLFQAVDKVANVLKDNCKPTEQPVGYMGKRSIYTVISYLAILKTGNIIVPIEEGYPDDYKQVIIKEAGIQYVLTPDSIKKTLKRIKVDKHIDDRVLNDRFPHETNYIEKVADMSNRNRPYLIIFTSGTTGNPKGVIHNQEQIINYCSHIWKYYETSPKDRICQRTGIGFIPSIWELFLGLLKGFATVILADELTKDPAKLIRAVSRNHISILQILPSMLKRITEGTINYKSLACVKLWLTAGEPMPQSLMVQLLECFPKSTFCIGFGATEVGGVIEYRSQDFIKNKMQTPGYTPIKNVKAYILDKNLKKCVPGKAGELYIGGPCLARGYINNLKGTNERFIQNPYMKGEKIYKTGDLARYLKDGRIQPIGRKDNQVKVRGMRVDLQVIEQVLAEIEGLRESAVAANATKTGVVQLTAFLVRDNAVAISKEKVQEIIKKRLPDYMIPAYYKNLDQLPRLANGKLNRRKLLEYCTTFDDNSCENRPFGIQANLLELISQIVGGKISDGNVHDNFIALGLDSITILDFLNKVNLLYKVSLEVSDLYDYSTVEELSEYIIKSSPSYVVPPSEEINNTITKDKENKAIAVIGMAGKFPGAKNLKQFWKNLVDGVCTITTVPEGRWNYKNHTGLNGKREGMDCRWGGFLTDIDKFDYQFFNLSQKECELMDPQQRLALEEAIKALEDAGYTKDTLDGKKVGVFIGAEKGDYANILKSNDLAFEPFASTGCDNSMLAARISYFLDSTGPSMTIDTACSSSLTAVHLAAENILNENCTIAIAGGVHIMTTPDLYFKSSNMNILSADGVCRVFDNAANGFVPGEGVGMVVLKELNAAIKDNDTIYGVILGSAINQNGKTNGMTAPSAKAQIELITSVYNKYNIKPENISYVEAHGTGTKLGDPIEWKALNTAFALDNSKKVCAVGSVKANVGHTITCAGITGLLKVLLTIQHNVIPPAINFTLYNEHIDNENSPLYVNTKAVSYQEGIRKTAAISSFGLSGTNCHMVIGEYSSNKSETDSDQYYLIPLSAKSPEALSVRVDQLKKWLSEEGRHQAMVNISYTLLKRRSHYTYRAAFVVKDKKALETELGSYNEENCCKISIQRNESGEEKYIGHTLIPIEVEKFATLYRKGNLPNWNFLYGENVGRTISMPTYPYESKRCWVKEKEFVNERIKKFEENIYCLEIFRGDLPVKEHVIQDSCILSGSQTLKLIHELVEDSFENKLFTLQSIVWKLPIKLSMDSVTIYVEIKDTESNTKFTVHAQSLKEPASCEGVISFETSESVYADKLHAEKKQKEIISYIDEYTQIKEPAVIEKDQIYDYYRQREIHYGESYRLIEKTIRKDNILLAALSDSTLLTDLCENNKPASQLLDAALHGIAGFQELIEDSKRYMPFSIGTLRLTPVQKTPQYVIINLYQKTEDCLHCSEILLLEEDGRIIMEAKDVVFRGVNQTMPGICGKDISFFTETFHEKALDCMVQENKKILIFARNNSDILECRTRYGDICKLLFVKISQEFLWRDDGVIEIKNCKDDIERAFHIISDLQFTYDEIFYLWSLSDLSEKHNTESKVLDVIMPIYHSMKQIMGHELLHRNIRFTYAYHRRMDNSYGYYGGLSGFFKTLALETGNLTFKAIEVGSNSSKNQLNWLEEIWDKEYNLRILYDQDIRQVSVLREDKQQSQFQIKAGIYIITGGLGGIGYHIADYLLTQTESWVVVIGRTELTSDCNKRMRYNDLQDKTGRMIYIKADVTNKEEIAEALDQVRGRFHKIDGIFHLAGIQEDNFFVEKTEEEFIRVIAPKIYGTEYLDELTREDCLEYFVLFSSVASEYGNTGQSDYAYANSFLDFFTQVREDKRKKGLCSGKTVTINWPHWLEGGMQLSEYSIAKFEKEGFLSLDIKDGIGIWLTCMGSNRNRLLIRKEKFKLESSIDERCIENKNRIPQNENPEGILNTLLKDILSDEMHIDKDSIAEDVSFDEYGINSFFMLNITERLEKFFGVLPKTLFFYHKSLKELEDYFLTEYKETLLMLDISDVTQKTYFDPYEHAKEQKVTTLSRQKITGRTYEIAVIGIAGRYPKAENLYEFWNNLRNGMDCITEIPGERWDYKEFYNSDGASEGCYSKWGGFLKDIDMFDPLFFNISPLEAERMDPQERIFMQTAWQAVENAGYTREKLKGYRVGVFVGVMWGQYQLFDAQNTCENIPKSNYASIANRVSYYFDFTGPSMAIDTMCSSSLTALKLACDNLDSGEIDFALVGGVNLCIHPYKYRLMCQEKFASTDGRCRSFGEGGDGYVPGEGVGAVFLTSHQQAVSDYAYIYGMIKANGINHGGKTNGYTVPNPAAQSELIRNVMEKSGISPLQLNYIEAHGTGTALGDPIEIEGLTRAFETYTDKKQFCAIASLKSNIGHLEAAAGIASLTKVLLQMKHKTIVPSLHTQKLNPYINFENTPVYVQTKLTVWMSPDSGSRCAGISSFGAGGANAFTIVEEYNKEIMEEEPVIPNPILILFSAKRKENLLQYVKQLKIFLETEKMQGNINWYLRDLAYTLQVGREAMDERLAVIITDLSELLKVLNHISADVDNVNKTENCFWGNVDNKNQLTKDMVTKSNNIMESNEVDKLLKQKRLEELANLWVNGAKIEWDKLYDDVVHPNLVPLPTYPFSQDSYWVKRKDSKEQPAVIHPLLDMGTSRYAGQNFSKLFTKHNEVLIGHRLQGRCILPGAVFLEMARAAGEIASNKPVTLLKNIRWMKVMDVEEIHREVTIALRQQGQYTYYSALEDNTLYANGELGYNEQQNVEKFPDLHDTYLLTMKYMSKKQYYSAFQERLLNYQGAYQSIEEVHYDKERVYAIVKVMNQSWNSNNMVLHPIVLDGIFQAVLPLEPACENSRLPYSIDEIILFGRLTMKVQVYAERSNDKYNIIAADDNNRVVLKILGLRITDANPIKVNEEEVIYFSEQWEPEVRESDTLSKDGDFLLFTETTSLELAEFVKQVGEEKKIYQVIHSPTYYINRHKMQINFDHEADYKELVVYLKEHKIKPEYIIFHWDNNNFIPLHETAHILAIRLLYFIRSFLESFSSIKILLSFQGKDSSLLSSSAAAFIKSAYTENHRNDFKILLWKKPLEYNIFLEEVMHIKQGIEELLYDNSGRYKRCLKELHFSKDIMADTVTSTAGVYLITGGTGSLGRIFGSYLAQSKTCTVVLVGRTSGKAVKKFFENGSVLEFFEADITEEAQVKMLYQAMKEKYHKIDGILHLAGCIQDCLIQNKTAEIVKRVCKPKIDGTILLDEITKDENLEFFITFSSLAAIVGNIGQVDYSYANRFMDMYIERRAEQVNKGLRSGRTLSVNWALWEQGGMHMAKESRLQLKAKHGLDQLTYQEGLLAFSKLYYNNTTGGLVLKGRRPQLLKYLSGFWTVMDNLELPRKASQEQTRAYEDLEDCIKRLVSDITKVPVNKIRGKDNFEAYGMDSVMLTELLYSFEKESGILDTDIFYKNKSIEETSRYLSALQQENQSCRNTSDYKEAEENKKMNIIPYDCYAEIAVTGIAGRYPMAENTAEFWKNILNGANCISTIPKERKDCFHVLKEEDTAKEAKGSIWGGFIRDVDKFEPLFFHISPVEAQNMDPQVRVMLEVTWNCLEDAGYSKEYLQRITKEGKRIGVFIGNMNQPYPWVADDLESGALLAGQGYWSIANRISHFLEITGPSVVFDTACSSSLTAMYYAMESLRKGECDIAIAGGVNLILHPYKYIGLAKEKMLSKHNISQSLCDGDGYIPGEGAGAVLLKRKCDAVQHNDTIYCVVKGYGMNHSGGKKAFKVPSEDAIKDLIQRVLSSSELKPEDIGYYELSSSGLKVGDMAELDAMKEIFTQTQTSTKLRIGAVKSNIGHLEAASGISQFTKVACILKNKLLAPSVNNKMTENTLDFENSPFMLQVGSTEWIKNSTDAAKPLRAMINSIGAGGTNVTFLMEEYVEPDKAVPADSRQKIALILSAASKASLLRNIKALLDYMSRYDEVSLYDIAYAFSRREALEERLAIITSSRAECIQFLQAVLDNSFNIGGIFMGSCTPSSEYTEVDLNISLEDMAKNWTKGFNYDWQSLYSEAVMPMFLPVYSFEKETYWIENAQEDLNNVNVLKHNNNLKEIIKEIFSSVLRIPQEKIDCEKSFFSYGFDSLKAMDMMRIIREKLTFTISIKELFQHNTILSLTTFLEDKGTNIKMEDRTEDDDNESFSLTLEKLILAGIRDEKLTVEQGIQLKLTINDMIKGD